MAKIDKVKKIDVGLTEIKDSFVVRQLFAELIGTFSYISISVLAGGTVPPNYMSMALANGIMYASMLQVFGKISGAHLNPAITLGALVCDRIRFCRAVCYIIVQAGGAILGALAAYHLTSESTRGSLSATVPNPSITAFQAFGLELMMTFVVVSVFLSIGTFNLTGPLATGLSISGCQFASHGLTGSLNPVRSLGPAVVMNIWQHHWVYWAGPLLGGLVAGVVHRIFQWRRLLKPSIAHAHSVTISPQAP